LLEVGAHTSHPFRIGNVPYRLLGLDGAGADTAAVQNARSDDVAACYAGPAGHVGLFPNRSDAEMPGIHRVAGTSAGVICRLVPGSRFDLRTGIVRQPQWGKTRREDGDPC
jgi:hypothetical protein